MRFEVKAPDGRTVVLEGDSRPTDSDLDEIFSNLPQTQQPKQLSAEELNTLRQQADESNRRAGIDTSGLSVAKEAVKGFGTGVLGGVERLLGGATFGATDWIGDKLGTGVKERRKELEDASGAITALNAGLDIVGGIPTGGALFKGLSAGAKAIPYVGKALKYAVPTAGGAITGGLYSGFENDSLDSAGQGAIAGGLTAGILDAGLRGAGKLFSAVEKVKNTPRGFENAVGTKEGARILNRAVRESDDIAERVYGKAPEALDNLNVRAMDKLDDAVKGGVDVKGRMAGAKKAYGDFIDVNKANQVVGLPTQEQLSSYSAESRFNPNIGYSRADALTALETRAKDIGLKISNNIDKVKNAQLKYILENNPADDSLGNHTWVKKLNDIKTYDEAIKDFGGLSDISPDFKASDVEKALKSGKVRVYSSKPIENANWVSPSKMEATSYSGGGKIYSKEVPLQDVAWVDEIQGQYAPVSMGKGHLLKDQIRVQHARTLKNTMSNPDVRFSQGDKTIYSKKYDINSDLPFDYIVQNNNGDIYGKYMTNGDYLLSKINKTADNISINGRVMKPTNAGYINTAPNSSDIVAQKMLNVKKDLSASDLGIKGLTDNQKSWLNQAWTAGKRNTLEKAGSLGHLDEMSKELNKMVQGSRLANPNGVGTVATPETVALQGLKDKVDDVIEKAGLQNIKAQYRQAKALEDSFNQGLNFNPNSVKTRNITFKTPDEQSAFAQGLVEKVKMNPESKNIAGKTRDLRGALRKALGEKADGVFKEMDNINKSYKNVEKVLGNAERKLSVPEPINGKVGLLREFVESPGSVVGGLADFARRWATAKSAERAAKYLLDPTLKLGNSPYEAIRQYAPTIGGLGIGNLIRKGE